MTSLARIAAEVGVSVSTVSRVLNRKPGIHDETRRRVLAVLDTMPNTPRGVGSLRRTGVIGLLVPELSNPVFPAFAEALESRAARKGYASLLCNTRAAMTEDEYVRMLNARGVEGMIFVSPEIATLTRARKGVPGRYRRLMAEGVRVVFVNGGAPTVDVPDVAIDEHRAGYIGTRHLLDLGHRRIGFVSGPASALASRLKRDGWSAALNEADEASRLIAHDAFSAEGGARAMAELLEVSRPTAVICSSDVMAFGAIRLARERGLSVPEDLSVVGFDDIPLAAYSHPALTTLAQPIDEMAGAAVDQLALLLDPDVPARRGHDRRFSPSLVARESTSPPPGSA